MTMKRFNLIKSILFAALLAMTLPVLAAAQGTYDPWGRNNRNNGRYDERYLRDSIQRLDRLAKDFERDFDRALDRSRQNGTRREDMLNGDARQFRNAVGDLKSRFGNGRDLNRTRDEAQRVLQIGDRLERVAFRVNDGRVNSELSQIGQELRIIADAYGLRGYNNGRNGRNDDIYRRTPNNNDPWWQRIPGVRYPY
jgi:hypothetical protein